MKDVKQRMQHVLNRDRLRGGDMLPLMIKSEVYDLLSDFFVIEDESLKVSVTSSERGLEIVIRAIAERTV